MVRTRSVSAPVTSTSIAMTFCWRGISAPRGGDPPTMLLDGSYSAKPDAPIRCLVISTWDALVT